MKLGVAIVVLFVGFEGDGEDMVGGDMIMAELPDTSSLFSRVEDNAELSDGLRSKSSVGNDDMADGRKLSEPRESNLLCVAGSSRLVSVCGIGRVDRIDSGRTHFGATRCEASV